MPINVVDCGAVSDRTVNDNDPAAPIIASKNDDAFRKAHDVLPATGGTIIIPAGKYRLSKTWTITKPVNLLGEAPPTTQGTEHGVWLYFNAGIPGINLPSTGGSDASTSQISNLFVSSQSTGKPQAGDGIVIGVHGVIIRDCAFVYFGGHGIVIGDGTRTNNANNTLIEATRCVENGSDGFHLDGNISAGNCNACTFICLECTGNNGWGFWHKGGAKNTFINANADCNTLGAFHEAGNSTVWINCYSEGPLPPPAPGKPSRCPEKTSYFEVEDGVIGLFCLAGNYGAPLKFIGGANALNSSGNIIIAPGRDFPRRLRLSTALELGGWEGSAGQIVDNTGSVQIMVGGGIGFYGTAPVPQPTVGGSCGGNAALWSLVQKLIDLGLIKADKTLTQQ